MSWVTDVIVCLNVAEKFDENYNTLETCGPIEEIREWLRSKELGELNELTLHMIGGGKAPQSYVYGGSYDYLPIDEFRQFTFSRKWNEPDCVQILLNDENDMKYTLYTID